MWIDGSRSTRIVTRRDALKALACGFGYLAFAGLAGATTNPLAARAPHFRPRAKRIIFLFMQGGPSQVDTFDYKPRLEQEDGKKLPPPIAPFVAISSSSGPPVAGILRMGPFMRAGR